MISQIATVVSLILLILVGGHLFFWYSIVKFFHIVRRKIRMWILAIITFFALSFPIATVLVHTHDNMLSSAYYFMSGVWIGMMLNVMMATILAWIIILIAKLFKRRVKTRVIAIIFFSIAIIYTGHGVWNAHSPKITNIEVPMKNLPKEWEGKTIVQLSDVHLGYFYDADFLSGIVKKVNDLHPEVVLITGDLFDGMDGRMDTFAPVLNTFEATDGVYFITGNHETYVGLEKVMEILAKTNIKVLNDEIVDLKGIQLIGVSFTTFGTTKDITQIIQPGVNFTPDKPSILMYHVPASIALRGVSSHANSYWKPNTDFSYAKNLGINLQLSGHTHAGQLFPITLVTDFLYNGFDYGLHTDGTFSIYISSGVGTWGPPMRTGNTPEIVLIKLKPIK